MTDTQTLEILEVIKSLPSEKVDEVKDFAIFLRDHYAKNEMIGESDEWTEEDLRDFSSASFKYFEESEREDEATK
jgi:hypothetical protein